MMRPNNIEKLLLVALAALLLSFFGCGGGSDDSGSGVNRGTLPWPSPFIEQGYTQEQVVELATAVRDEYAELVDASTREELTEHIAMLFASGAEATPKQEGSITIEPETVSEAWAMAGVSAVFQGSAETAFWCFSNGVLADPSDGRALSQLGWALLLAERIDEAKGVLLHGVDVDPTVWSLWSNLGHAAVESGEPERAIYYFGRGLEHHPESLNMHLRLGGLELERGNLVAAAAHATHALAISPQDAEAKELADAVMDAGGDSPTPPPPQPPPLGDGMGEVLRDFDDCTADAALRYSEAMAPFSEGLLEADQAHRFRLAEIHERWVECDADCAASSDSCFEVCLSRYCGAATTAELENWQRHLHVASVDMSYNAAFRTRIRGCAYNAVETYEEKVSEEAIQDFIVYVNWLTEVEAEASRASFQDEQADLASRLPVTSECTGDVSSIPEEELSLSFDLESLGISIGMEVCLDRIVCIDQGETSFGISVGVDIVSGGVTVDYGNPDIIFSLGVGKELGAGSVGISAKLSFRNGIGISPSAKYGGIVRTTVSRDFWLLSF